MITGSAEWKTMKSKNHREDALKWGCFTEEAQRGSGTFLRRQGEGGAGRGGLAAL